MNFNIKFILSAAELKQLPHDTGSEVAFIGRSNVGKSSAINAIAGMKIARAGKTPGVTQLINVYQMDEHNRLIDLPGYGYAKVAKTISASWQRLVKSYLEKRSSLKGLFVLMDIRHPLGSLDQELLAWTKNLRLPVAVLLTKADKLTHTEAHKVLVRVAKELQHYNVITVQIFSAKTKLGLEEVFERLDIWL